MSIALWIVIIAIAIFAVLVVIGMLCIAADEGDVYSERDCRATVERSNGLGEEIQVWTNAYRDCWREFDEQLNQYKNDSGLSEKREDGE